jgi:N-acetylglucosamine kinase-like BadF-type ATPase
MGKIIIGVDGGGTKSHLAMFDVSGACIGTSACGPLNHESMDGSFGELEPILVAFIQDSVKKAGSNADDVAYAVLGVAGVDTAAQHAIISDMLRKAGLRHFMLCNDSFLGVAAGCPEGAGISLINGTGTSMAAVDYSGNTLQVAGLGDFTDDCGGGGWYGRQVLAAVYNSLYKKGRATSLCGTLFSMLGISRKEDYIEALTAWFIKGGLGGAGDAGGDSGYGAIGRYVFEAADAGDAAAVAILDKSAEHFAGGIACMATEMDFPESRTLHVSFAGSVFVKEKVQALPKLIEERVRLNLGAARQVDYHKLDTVPVAGAVLWAAQKAGFNIEMKAIKDNLARSGL